MNKWFKLEAGVVREPHGQCQCHKYLDNKYNAPYQTVTEPVDAIHM